jgi:hypothetical protein
MKLKELIKFINDIAKKIKPYCEIAKETKKKIKEVKKND